MDYILCVCVIFEKWEAIGDGQVSRFDCSGLAKFFCLANGWLNRIAKVRIGFDRELGLQLIHRETRSAKFEYKNLAALRILGRSSVCRSLEELKINRRNMRCQFFAFTWNCTYNRGNINNRMEQYGNGAAGHRRLCRMANRKTRFSVGFDLHIVCGATTEKGFNVPRPTDNWNSWAVLYFA